MSEMEKGREIAISRFISAGGLNDHHQDTSTLLREAAVMMDRVCGDLFGPVFFEGADGRIYSLTLGASIDEVDPDYVEDVLTEASPGYHAGGARA